jgi:hypothetical protein
MEIKEKNRKSKIKKWNENIGGKIKENKKEKWRALWVFHPLIHVTQVGETILPNVFLKMHSSLQQNPLYQHSHNRSCHNHSQSPAKRTLRFHWSSGLLGLAWLTDGWRSMLSGRWDEEVRPWEDRMDWLGQTSCFCALHFFNYLSLNFYYAIWLCILLFDFVISVMYLRRVYWYIVMSMHDRVWLTGCVIVLLLGSTRFYGSVFPICFFVFWLCSTSSRLN